MFNQGAFHLATSRGAPIPTHIPDEAGPGPPSAGLSLDVRPGTVHVTFQPTIDTAGWKVEDVERHRDEVRAMDLRWARELMAGRTSG